jgi:hypothetical protein
VTDPDDVTRLLQDAVRAEAARVEPDADAALDVIRARGRAARNRRRAVAAAVGVAAAVVVAVALPSIGGPDRAVMNNPAASTTAAPAPEPTSAPPTTEAPATTETPPTTTETPTTEAPSATSTTTEPEEPPAEEFDQPPLYPFRSLADVEEWQAAYAASGTQPWHLDAEATALSFTGFLGFTDVDQVLDSTIDGADAYVTVGYDLPEGGLAPAAVVHLVRFGTGDDAPWEVVGTRDDRLTLDRPDYGSTVSSPLTVGGVITGVDESLRVQVRQPSSQAPLGESCCVPAGGERAPWEATVSFSGATDPALTVVVSTGGHVQDVEAFAITAIRH